jgi:putative FmdB family regulatory protein
MPIYEYRCQSCGDRAEILVRSGANTSPACPSCGGTVLERLLSVPYVMTSESRLAGRTCCGQEERCETPPCSGERTRRREL